MSSEDYVPSPEEVLVAWLEDRYAAREVTP